ncbi:hypothetical protein [Proteus terrae]|uniref:hypothetical protein n=1 Tax=Proteus terrae TaxID=1574161 RepID=UPI001BA9DA89|nr:hypothetical protein [Proteus terrae]QUT02790.1 hypothetical protein KF949_05095 [Proteus terrae subsp. cibarius]
MNELKEEIINLLKYNKLTKAELYYLCSPEYSKSQVSCVIGHLEAGGIIRKGICEYLELINE